MQIDTSVSLLSLFLKNAHVQLFSVSSTTGVKNILQTNQMQQHFIHGERSLMNKVEGKEKRKRKKKEPPLPNFDFYDLMPTSHNFEGVEFKELL